MAQKTNLKQKLAVAMSVVNALNVGAAVALPYANMTKSIVADGAKVQRLVDGVAGAMYGTAQARLGGRTTSTITSTDSKTNLNMDDGDIIIEGGGQTTATTLSGTETTSGAEIIKYDETNKGGIAKKTTINRGGTQIVSSGGITVNPSDGGGVLELHGGAVVKQVTFPHDTDEITSTNADTFDNLDFTKYLQGGTLRLMDGYKAEGVTVNNGVIELGAGGTAVGTVLDTDGANHGEEVITNGGLSQRATINNGGTQIVQNGGTSKQANINGGTQTVMSGGISEGATVNGGTQHILGGATASGITMAGGTVSVEDDATAKIAAATSGTLELLETGGARAEFGNATTVANFTLTNLNASNDTVILGMGNNATAVVGKNLTIGTMTGNAKFVINTDIAKNKSDTITINNVTGTSQNTVRINYDPTLATNKTVPTNTLVATVKAGTATFTGVESTVGGFDFTPLITSKGNSWYITGFENAGPSEQMYASVDTATWQAIAWRDSNFVIGSRMAQLHHDPSSAHQNDFWVDFTRGRNRTNNFGHAMNRTYDRVSVGYDRLVGHGWTVGLAYGYEKGTEGYEKGSGDSTGNVVTAYATWQGANGNYVDMTIKGGQLESDFTVQDDNQVTPSKADTRATGAGVSAVFGHRFENASAFYVEPHAGFYWSHLGGYDYRLSDGSDVSVDGCNSFVGNLGVNIGKLLGKGEVYARADFMHDFSGNVRVSMTKAGLNNTMENPLHDSWLNVAVGYRQNYDRVGWYAEAGCQSIGSRESSGDWVWKAGVEFKF